MDEPEVALDLDRGEAMIVLYAQGYSFADMVGPLTALRLLACQEQHRKRPQGDHLVCATCENTLLVAWRRRMKALGATKEDLAEVKGMWFTAHNAVEQICAKRYLQEVVTETTRTETIDGKPVVTTTVKTETHIHVGLLRLWVDVRDKIARMSGLNVKNPASLRPIQRRLIRVFEREADGSADEPAN